MKLIKRHVFLLLFSLLFSAILLGQLKEWSRITRLTQSTVSSMDFRSQPLSEERLEEAKEMDSPGEMLGVCMLETDFGRADTDRTLKELRKEKNRWEQRPGWGR